MISLGNLLLFSPFFSSTNLGEEVETKKKKESFTKVEDFGEKVFTFFRSFLGPRLGASE